jgi:NAD(P)-dependent dehydrogenase (short-subunit alcohol dehydrogenase family)
MGEGHARCAVVTGSSSGIGEAIARRLSAEGWLVTGIDRAAAEDASYLAAEEMADLADSEAVSALAARLEAPVALVHAAGFMRPGRFDELDPADGDLMWAVHVRAFTQLVQGFLPRMADGSRIIAIGSRTSNGAAGKAQYSATKAALRGLVRSIAAEAIGRRITANTVSPAATATPLLTQGDRAAIPPITPPIGRFIEPDEVAATVSFLLSDGAAAITGQDILICGGASL